jgi:hypothetical protein
MQDVLMTVHPIPVSASFNGEWWLPEKPAAQISGTLTWEPDCAKLELHGTFAPRRGHIFADETAEYPLLHGRTTRSELVTVLNAMRTGSPMHIGAGGMRETERMISSWVVIGAHLVEGATYTELSARIPGLEIWFDPGGGIIQTVREPGDQPVAIIYEIQGVKETRCEIPSISALLAWGTGRTQSGEIESEFSVRTHGYLTIRSEVPQTLDWFISQLGRATTLLALITGSPMSPDHLATKTEDGRDVEILVALRDAKYCVHRTSHDFFMLRRRMEVDVGTVFEKWYEIYDKVEAPSQLALSVLYSKNLWLHVEFLSLMQALEGYHRAVVSGAYMSKETYESVRELLCSAIPTTLTSDHRASLKSKVRFGYEYSLRKRMDELVKKLDEPLRRHILGDDGRMPGSWVDTRNYYTHWDESLRTEALDAPDMHRATVRMKHLLRALYLQLVGVPQSAILQSLTGFSKESQYLIQLNAREHRKKNPGSTAGSFGYISSGSDESA